MAIFVEENIYKKNTIGGGSNDFFNLHPDPWGNDPNLTIICFQMGWYNQLDQF